MTTSQHAFPSHSPSPVKRAVFLDRDGTLNIEAGYIQDLNNLNLIPGAAQAIKKLNDAGILAILTTNQTGAARKYYGLDHIHALNARLEKLLQEEAGATLDAIYYSPYLSPTEVKEGTEVDPQYIQESACRKPGIGMIEQAITDFPGIDLAQCVVVGDKATDVEMAANAHCKGILLKTGYGERVLAGTYQTLTHTPDAVCESIVDAVDQILIWARSSPSSPHLNPSMSTSAPSL